MADNGITGKVLGLACDGTGYGDDGSVWGCELFLCDEVEYSRIGSLKSFPLPGGDKAAVDLWRPALSLLMEAFGDDWLSYFKKLCSLNFGIPNESSDVVTSVSFIQSARFTAKRMLSESSKIVRTSSLGRLFDGVGFILGVCEKNHHEAETAMALESLALEALAPEDLSIEGLTAKSSVLFPHINCDRLWKIIEENNFSVIDVSELIKTLVLQKLRGQDIRELALLFHKAVAAMLTELLLEAVASTKVKRVVLSGGCFINSILLNSVRDGLKKKQVNVYTHHQVSPGDGGLALGQAFIASRRILRRGL